MIQRQLALNEVRFSTAEAVVEFWRAFSAKLSLASQSDFLRLRAQMQQPAWNDPPIGYIKLVEDGITRDRLLVLTADLLGSVITAVTEYSAAASKVCHCLSDYYGAEGSWPSKEKIAEFVEAEFRLPFLYEQFDHARAQYNQALSEFRRSYPA